MDHFMFEQHPIFIMSDSTKSNDWEKLWSDYANSLNNWKQMFESMQKANEEMQARFNTVMEKAAKESSLETMKSFGENWQKAINKAGLDAYKSFGESWQKAMNEATVDAYKQFAENWQKSLSSSGLDQMKAYGELMKKFAETWNNMWPQKSGKS